MRWLEVVAVINPLSHKSSLQLYSQMSWNETGL